jgi:hypothetical protein
MKLPKLRSKPVLKNVVIISWYGEIILIILNEIKSIRIKAHLDITIMHPLGTKVLTNEKKIHLNQKDF